MLVVSIADREGSRLLLEAPLGSLSDEPRVIGDERDGFEGRLRCRTVDDDGLEIEVEVTRTAPAATEAAIRLGVRLGAASDPWLLIPGVLYGENRPAGSTLPYPAWRLAPDPDDPWASDRWIVRADRAATPMALASDGRTTVALATREAGELGLHGLEVAATRDATEVAVWAPFREWPLRYDGSPRPQPAVAALHAWQPRETRTVHARAYAGPPDRYAFVPILRALDAWLAPYRGADGGADSEASAWATLDGAAALAAEGLCRWHWRPAHEVLLETAAFERGPGDPPPGEVPGDRVAMHVGWLSGAPTAAALLAHGRRTGHREAVEVGERVIDGICRNLAPAGTFWGQWTAAAGWTKGWTPGEDRLHARTLA
ncbi:MAG TPA: hypothetical protein VKB30_05920, partial [Candidatus Limnocylindrales bacterium]|nr:hypothetical protein [Candidatus Limnocylindrales bacterium]